MAEAGEITMTKVNIREIAPISKLQEPLDDENWATWRQSITRLLRLAGILGIVNGIIPKPGAESGDLDVWNFNDEYAQILITQNIMRSQMIHVGRLQSSHDMWTALEDIHEAKGNLTAIGAQRILFKTRAEEGDNIEEHLTKLKGAWEYLGSLDAEDFTVTDVQFKAIVSSSLPSSWDPITDPYVGRRKGETVTDPKKKASSQEMMGAIKEEYRRRQARDEESSIPHAFYSQPKNRSRPSLNARIGDKVVTKKCGTCGYTNHKTEDCRRRKCSICGLGHKTEDCYCT
jgi:hypothetical protein